MSDDFKGGVPLPRPEAVWMYFVQREACGLTRHDAVIEAYAIPASVLAKVGARRPSSNSA